MNIPKFEIQVAVRDRFFDAGGEYKDDDGETHYYNPETIFADFGEPALPGKLFYAEALIYAFYGLDRESWKTALVKSSVYLEGGIAYAIEDVMKMASAQMNALFQHDAKKDQPITCSQHSPAYE